MGKNISFFQIQKKRVRTITDTLTGIRWFRIFTQSENIFCSFKRICFGYYPTNALEKPLFRHWLFSVRFRQDDTIDSKWLNMKFISGFNFPSSVRYYCLWSIVFRTGAQTNAVSTDDAVYFMGLNSPWEPAKEIHKFQNNQWTLNVGRLLSDQYHRTSIQIGNEFLIYGNSWITELWNPETDTSSNMSGNAFGLGLYRPQLFGVRSDFCQPSNWFRYSITKSLQFHYIIFGLVS